MGRDARQYQCAPQGQVLLLPGARSVYELNEDYERTLAPRRAEFWKTGDQAQRLTRIRQLTGIRRLEELPQPAAESAAVVERPGYRVEKLVLKSDDGIVLPAVLFLPEKAKPQPPALYIHEDGKTTDAAPGGPIERLVRDGTVVLAVDLRGTGQTKPAGSEWKDVYTGYLLGRSYVGLRAEDVLQAARWLHSRTAANARPSGVRLIAVGHPGIPALHAAALEPGLFQSVQLVRTLASWSGVVRSRLTQVQASQIVHGALTVYDLPDLAASLGSKFSAEQPTNGKP